MECQNCKKECESLQEGDTQCLECQIRIIVREELNNLQKSKGVQWG
jgi:DNA-directed RNA polymerase subunit RPC12/RpoP